MTTLAKNTTIEDILALASSSITAVNAQHLDELGKWSNLSTDGVMIWGDFEHSGGSSYYRRSHQTVVNLSWYLTNGSGLHCNCYERKPCVHSIGLILAYRERPESFATKKALSFQHEKLRNRITYDRPNANVLPQIQQGANQLETWLITLLQQGLSQAHVRNFEFWDDMAKRAIGSHMPGVAQWLMDVANIPVRGGDWYEPLLHELGQMYLLVKSVQRFEELSPEVKADVRQAIGWHLTLQDFDPHTAVRDQWFVVGKKGRKLFHDTPEQLIWLYGIQTGKVALLHTIGEKEVADGLHVNVGQVVDLALVYLPSTVPMTALPVQVHGIAQSKFFRGTHISDAIAVYGEALAKNPWLKNYPLILSDVIVSRRGKYWIVRHEDGTYLPIAPRFKHKWTMFAASSTDQLQIAGIWNGYELMPLSITTATSVIDMDDVLPYKTSHTIRKQPRIVPVTVPEDYVLSGIIGTSIQPLPADTTKQSAEALLLTESARLNLREAAGYIPHQDDLAVSDAVTEDNTTTISEESTRHLRLMLSGIHREALREWLFTANQANRHVDETLLPKMLLLGQKQTLLRPYIKGVIGQKGYFLAREITNQNWKWVLDTPEYDSYDLIEYHQMEIEDGSADIIEAFKDKGINSLRDELFKWNRRRVEWSKDTATAFLQSVEQAKEPRYGGGGYWIQIVGESLIPCAYYFPLSTFDETISRIQRAKHFSDHGSSMIKAMKTIREFRQEMSVALWSDNDK